MHRFVRPGNRFPTWVKGRRVFSPAAVAHFNHLGAQVRASIVVSSSWRTKPDCRELLEAAGVQVPFHKDWRIDSNGPDRGGEINRWLIDHKSCPFVILDDWPRELTAHAPRVVRPDFRVGLQQHDVSRALDVLGA
jgi:hypothetical protein